MPLVDQMNPDASTLAAGGPVDLDVSKIEENAQVVIRWRQRPIFVFRRSQADAQFDAEQQMMSLLSDPNSEQTQQPPYATNWHRSLKPEYGMLVGICTHLGCIPLFYPDPERDDAGDPIGRAAISVPATAPNTIRPAASSPACRRRTICRCRPIVSSMTPRCASAKRSERRGLEFRLDPPALSRHPAQRGHDLGMACFRAVRLAHNAACHGGPSIFAALAVATAGFCAFVNLYSPQALLPELAGEFRRRRRAKSASLMTAGTAAIALSAPFTGALADVVGRKRLITAAMFAIAVPTVIMTFAGSVPELTFWRFVQGLLLPPIFTVTVAYIGDEWPPARCAAHRRSLHFRRQHRRILPAASFPAC